jgi:ABC-type cobalamin/Fe3+-siderophores transport system ATPase subunit
LEHAIFRVSEGREAWSAVARVLKALDLEDHFMLVYVPSRKFKSLLKSHSSDNRAPIDSRVFIAEANRRSGYSNSKLSREINIHGERFLDLLQEAFDVLERIRTDAQTYSYSFSYSRRQDSHDYASLQSLALLRRLDIISLDSCYLKQFNGKQFDVANASSGQQQLLCSFISLAANLQNECVVLIDEPELSLHPKWQMGYLDDLISVVNSFSKCHVIIATHSPLIVQRALELKLNVVQLGSESEALEAPKSIESTLLDVFETPTSESTQLANRLFKAVITAETGGQVEKIAAKGES